MSDNFSKLSWETIEKANGWSPYEPYDGSFSEIRRAKVFGGWLVDKKIIVKRTFATRDTDVEYDITTSMTFVPDPQHKWTP